MYHAKNERHEFCTSYFVTSMCICRYIYEHQCQIYYDNIVNFVGAPKGSQTLNLKCDVKQFQNVLFVYFRTVCSNMFYF